MTEKETRHKKDEMLHITQRSTVTPILISNMLQ